MLENVLVKRNCSARVKIAVKSLVSAGLVLLAVVLPQLVHAAFGAQGGVLLMPMYLPVLLGGCLLGTVWGLGVGILSPIVSFALTYAFGNPMPALARLPFMTAELAVFAVISGAFSKKIAENGWMAFPAVVLAQAAGRAAFLLLALVFSSVSAITPAAAWSQVAAGMPGMFLQTVLLPFAVMGLKKLLAKSRE